MGVQVSGETDPQLERSYEVNPATLDTWVSDSRIIRIDLTATFEAAESGIDRVSISFIQFGGIQISSPVNSSG